MENLFCDRFRPAEAGDLIVEVVKVDAQGAVLRLLPSESAMLSALTEAAGNDWGITYKLIGGVMVAGLTINGVYREAAGCNEYRNCANKVKAAMLAAMYQAMRHFGAWASMTALPLIRLDASAVHIAPGEVNGSYVIASPLKVDKLAVDELGAISHVQFVDGNGGKVVWQK